MQKDIHIIVFFLFFHLLNNSEFFYNGFIIFNFWMNRNVKYDYFCLFLS